MRYLLLQPYLRTQLTASDAFLVFLKGTSASNTTMISARQELLAKSLAAGKRANRKLGVLAQVTGSFDA
jgi:hypothetical protein